MTEVISRKDARKAGFLRYFTGKPCKSGHICERYVQRGTCLECAKIATKKYKFENPNAQPTQSRNYRLKNLEKLRAQSRLNYRNNKEYFREHRSRRRECVSRATISKIDIPQIRELYLEAVNLEQSCGKKFNCDHIIPLRGKLVCGLNVPDNLQVISEKANQSKSKRFDLELYNKVYNSKIKKSLEECNKEYTECLLSHLKPSEIWP